MTRAAERRRPPADAGGLQRPHPRPRIRRRAATSSSAGRRGSPTSPTSGSIARTRAPSRWRSRRRATATPTSSPRPAAGSSPCARTTPTRPTCRNAVVAAVRRGRRRRDGALRRQRLRRLSAAQPRRRAAGLDGLGPSQHAVGRHPPLRRRPRRRRPGEHRGGRRRAGRSRRWSRGGAPTGRSIFISDRTGFWNLYVRQGGETVPVLARDAEFGGPLWQLGQAQLRADGRRAHRRLRAGGEPRCSSSTRRGRAPRALALPFTSIRSRPASPG